MSTLSDWCNAMTLEHLLQYRTLRSVSEILIHISDVSLKTGSLCYWRCNDT